MPILIIDRFDSPFCNTPENVKFILSICFHWSTKYYIVIKKNWQQSVLLLFYENSRKFKLTVPIFHIDEG